MRLKPSPVGPMIRDVGMGGIWPLHRHAVAIGKLTERRAREVPSDLLLVRVRLLPARIDDVKGTPR